MKRSEMVKGLQEWIKRCDYPCSAWEFVEQAEDIIEFLESKGMQPPPYFKTVLTGPPAKEGVSNLVLLSRVEKCEGWEDEE
jgi:hypothetical protein